MKCLVVTPEKTEVDCETTFVAVPLFDGEYGIAPLHTPVVGRIGAGELRVTTSEGAVERYFIEGGFVEVNSDVVSILTNRLTRPDGLDIAASEKTFAESVARSAGTFDAARQKEKDVQAARQRLRVARKWAGK